MCLPATALINIPVTRYGEGRAAGWRGRDRRERGWKAAPRGVTALSSRCFLQWWKFQLCLRPFSGREQAEEGLQPDGMALGL